MTLAFRAWQAAGRPWELARPVAELQAWAAEEGVRVLGTIGNDAHVHSDHPKDHTPFSSTEWPFKVVEPVVFAIDLENVRRGGVTLGEAIEAQARAGLLPWLKYMNHAHRHLDSRDLDGDGKRFEVEDSSDDHVHLSVRTDWWKKSIGDFDPWGTGDDMPSVEDLIKGQVKLTKETARRINKDEGAGLGLGLLIQYAVCEASDAKDVAEANAKRTIGLEAKIDALARVLGDVADATIRQPEPAAPPEKVTPATVAKKATSAPKPR